MRTIYFSGNIFLNCISEESDLIFNNLVFTKAMKEKTGEGALLISGPARHWTESSNVQWSHEARQTEREFRR